MSLHAVRASRSAAALPRAGRLAWRIAEVAGDPVAVEAEVAEMIGNRIIDNAAVAAASLTPRPVASARAQALAHPRKFRTLAEGGVLASEQDRLLGTLERLTKLRPDGLSGRTFALDPAVLGGNRAAGTFERRGQALPELSVVSG